MPREPSRIPRSPAASLLLSPGRAVAAVPKDTPHFTQIIWFALVSTPQAWQYFVSLPGATPQLGHATACSPTSVPQFRQCMQTLPIMMDRAYPTRLCINKTQLTLAPSTGPCQRRTCFVEYQAGPSVYSLALQPLQLLDLDSSVDGCS
jgi:hypothetical protein